ncbi:hypothetical protein [Rhizobium bangladeshense]|uniref:hypothetical protein n=1 Tax=Rhizobium bangladeshense TaxID=1138189 RepID=UPI001C909A39|nr:hypothetical protein [Rhizobium bangladeshense]MBY3595980.1 hypothetical protein [Rhizobium bangladeshense]
MAEAHGRRVLDRLDDPFVHLFTPPLSGSREAVAFRDGKDIRRMVACGKSVFVRGMVAAVMLCGAALTVRFIALARLLSPAQPLLLHPGHHLSSVIPGTTSPPSSQGLTLGSMRLALQKSDDLKGNN